MKVLLRLYPTAWRARYEAEVSAVLEARGTRLLDGWDLLRAALDAHLHPVALGHVPTAAGRTGVPLRMAGWAALIGGALWAVAYVGVYLASLVVGSANAGTGHGIAPEVGQSWLIALMVAPAFLVAAQVSVTRSIEPRRPWHLVKRAPALVTAIGALLMTAKLVVNAVRPDRHLLGDTGQPEIWVIGMFVLLIGSLAIGVLLLAGGVVRRRVCIPLLVGALLNGAFLCLTGATHVMTALRYSGGIVLAGVVFGVAFMGLGIALVRHRPTDQVSDAVPIAES
jgi:hypothetical protein